MTNPQCIHIPDGSVVVSGDLFDMACAAIAERDKLLAEIERLEKDLRRANSALVRHGVQEMIPGNSPINAPEPRVCASRDADHCDYPDCEQHWTDVVAQARALLEPLADCDPAIRQWLKTPDLPKLQGASRDASSKACPCVQYCADSEQETRHPGCKNFPRHPVYDPR